MFYFSPAKFFNPAYLFDLHPYTYPSTINLMIGFFGLMLVAGVAIKLYRRFKSETKTEKKLLDKYTSFLISLGLIGLAMTWFRYERINLLAGRFWLIIWLAVAGFWLYRILNYQLKVIPKIKKDAENRQLLQKYLPKKK
jgi:hypothetical protein